MPGERRDEPEWLSEDETRAWLALAAVMLTLPAALDAQLQRDSEMTFYEYVVLAALSNAPDRSLRLSDLAALTAGSLSRLSQVITRMEKRSWVARRTDPGDGRYTIADLTEAGLAAVVAAAPGHVANVRRLVFDPLSATQVGQLRSVNRRIRDGIAPESLLFTPAWQERAARRGGRPRAGP